MWLGRDHLGGVCGCGWGAATGRSAHAQFESQNSVHFVPSGSAVAAISFVLSSSIHQPLKGSSSLPQLCSSSLIIEGICVACSACLCLSSFRGTFSVKFQTFCPKELQSTLEVIPHLW